MIVIKKKVISEVSWLKDKYGLDGIRFYDDNFFANRKRAIDILEVIDIPWEGEFCIGSIPDELAAKIGDTKCRGICFGIESGNDRILKLMNKDQTVEEIVEGIRIMSRYPEVRINGTIILTNLTETREEIRNSINLCVKLWEIHPRVTFSIGTLLPYPGVPLYELILNAGYKAPMRTEDWEIVNRSNTEMEVSWLPWVIKKDIKNFVYAGRYAQLLPFGNLRNPVLRKIAKWRLSHYNFVFPVELRLLEWVHGKFADRSSRLSRALRPILPHITHRGKAVQN